MYERISVYVVAHQDDWQLFMEPDISTDSTDPACKTVVIHTTAGDAGLGRQFWEAREAGAIQSLLFRLSHGPAVRVDEKYVCLAGRKIFAAEVANCSLYFLRLPDGGMNGQGFRANGFQSLSKIRRRLDDRITTVDGENTFYSAQEISNVLSEIHHRELAVAKPADPDRLTLSFPEYDPALTPDDHDDHFSTALLLRETTLYKAAKKYAFVHYDTQHSAPDLTGTPLFWKVGMFCVYHQTVFERQGYSTIDESAQYYAWSTKDTLRREIT